MREIRRLTRDYGALYFANNRVAVMYAGNIVEASNVFDVFKEPLHPYTRALIESRIRKEDKTVRKGLARQPPDLANSHLAVCFILGTRSP